MNITNDFSMFTDQLASLSKTGYFKVNLCNDESYANDEWYDCFGAEPGLRMVDVFSKFPYVHPVDHYSINAFLQNAKKGFEKKYMGYMRVRIPNRDIVWKWYQCYMIVTTFAPEKGVIEVVGMHHDVTSLMGENDQSMNVLSYLADLLQVFNTVPWTLDFRTKVVVTNRAFVKNDYGFNTLAHQMSFDEFLPSVLTEYQEGLLTLYERVRTGVTPRGNIEIQMYMGKSKTPVWIDCSIIAQEYDEKGEAVSAIGAMTVIQERKMAEQAIEDARQKAEHANKVKTNFLSSMSHEFRTPLNSILGFSTIMAHSGTMEERMQCLGAIQSSGSQLLQIVDDVLEYAQIEAGEIVLKQDRVELRSLIERMVEEIMPSRVAGVEMTFTSSKNEILVRGDEAKIAMVAKHLIGNATKYTSHGFINVSVERDNEYATVTISDSGRGMSKESLKHMYDRFYKGSEYVPGTGLGLSIVKHLVDMWKGEIVVESELNKGTTFKFTVPVYSNFY